MEGVPLAMLRAVVRAHYAELEDPTLDTDVARPLAESLQSCRGPRGELAQVRQSCSPEERTQLEVLFGPLDASGWAPLRDTILKTVAEGAHADCALQVCGGLEVPAHKLLVTGVEDGHFFSAALRWPGARSVISMPEGLSSEALMPLLRLRYGSEEVDVESILEMRHFAELFDWPAESKKCEMALETLLRDAETLDAESILTVVAHVDQNSSIPVRLKAAALSTAVRQWSKVTEVAEASLSKGRCAELGALARIRNRDGHVCGSLQEYLHAAADDLGEWERNMALDAPAAAKKQMENAWQHWHQLLFEYGHLNGARAAETWREKVRAARLRIREERSAQQGARLHLPEGKVWFEASREWQEVPGNAVCPAGLEYRFDMQTGRNYARLSD